MILCALLINNSFFLTAQACRTKVLKKLRIEFENIDDAEAAYGITYYNDVSSQVNDEESVLPGEVMQYVTKNFGKLSKVQRMELVTCQLRMLIEMDFSKDLMYFVPRDLLPYIVALWDEAPSSKGEGQCNLPSMQMSWRNETGWVFRKAQCGYNALWIACIQL